MIKIKNFVLLSLFLFFNTAKSGIVICTASDELYFDPLINLIGSIHKINFDDLEEICVYNLGMNTKQIEQVNSMQKVRVYEVDLVNPKLLKPNIIDVHGKSARGWYAWKPVIIKQTLDKFPAVIYMDSGNTVLQSLTDLFKHIEQNDYFFLSGSPHLVRDWTTKRVVDHFNLTSPERNFILQDEAKSISANIMGVTRKLYDSLILPMYNHAKELTLFIDDGSAPGGFGKCRHDQMLFNVYIYLLKLNITNQEYSILHVDGKKKIFHTHYYPHKLTNRSVIYQSRFDLKFSDNKINPEEPYFAQFIKYKKERENS